MSYATDPMGAALDRHITGNWGEDQFKGEAQYEDLCDKVCSSCFMFVLGQCEGELGDCAPCLIAEQAMMDIAMEEDFLEMEAERLREEKMDLREMEEERRMCEADRNNDEVEIQKLIAGDEKF